VFGREAGGAESYDLTRLDVIVSDHHEFMRDLICDVLRALGIRKVRSASDPWTAAQMFNDRPADLVFTDWSPGFDGIGFLRLVRDMEGSADPFVPIIIVTAHTELRHVCVARDAGATDFIAKPVAAKRLYARICAAIEQHRAFVRTRGFFGPDRRRRQMFYEGSNRRKADDDASAVVAPCAPRKSPCEPASGSIA